MRWRIRVADIAVTRGAPRDSRTGEGVSKKVQTKTLYILILTKPEAAVRASTPGEPLARAAAGATEKPCRMGVAASCQSAAARCLYTRLTVLEGAPGSRPLESQPE